MSRAGAVILAALLGLGSAFGAYRLGRAHGFTAAYQEAYDQGLKDSTCGVDTSKDPDEVCINHQCESEQN